MKKVFTNCFITLFAISFCFLIGCKEKEVKKEGVAYGIINEDYLGIARVKTTDGAITDVEIDEIYLPLHWATLEYTFTDTTLPDDILTVDDETDIYYSKYISIGGDIFTGKVENGKVVYSNDKISDLKEHLSKSEENAKWYIDALDQEKIFISNASGEKSNYTSAHKLGFKKSEGIGEELTKWKNDIKGFASFLKNKTLKALDKDKFVEEVDEKTGNKTWTINGEKTTLALENVPEYYNLVLKAYQNAK